MGLPVPFHLLLSRGSGVSGVLGRLGLFAVAINTDLVALAYVFLGGSNKTIKHPALRCASRGATTTAYEAGAYGSVLSRERKL